MYKDAKKVYAERWRHEFTSFLTCRKTEMANGGMMFLLIMSSDEARPNQLQGSCFQMLEESWIQLVEQGTLQSWQLETFNIPWHFPTLMELESAINGVSDLRIQQIRAMHTYVGDTYWKQWSNDPDELARRLTNFYRSIVSNVIEKHVGPMNCELIFTRFNDLLEKNLRSRSTWDPYWIYPWDHHAMVEITKEQ
ncbi:hypothetical protein KP509_10G041300 [Ceratopteris richardii]|nr:hypothetical protein KP509_10G041300 [Ceratopteris richardii]